MTSDFKQLWTDPSVANRERKRMLAYVIEDATLIKDQHAGTTKVHLRFKGGRVETLTTKNPKPSWQKVKTPSEIVALVDQLLDEHLYAEIASVLNAKGLQPGGSAWPGRHNDITPDLLPTACSTLCIPMASALASTACVIGACSRKKKWHRDSAFTHTR